MSFQILFLCKLFAANLAPVSGAISAMNSSHMTIQAALGFELPTTNLTLVSGSGVLWSWWRRRSDVAVSMRSAVGRVDSCLVAQ